MRGRLFTWVFRVVVLWGAQRIIRWFSGRYGDDRDHSKRRPGAGGPQVPRSSGRTGGTAAAGTGESRE